MTQMRAVPAKSGDKICGDSERGQLISLYKIEFVPVSPLLCTKISRGAFFGLDMLVRILWGILIFIGDSGDISISPLFIWFDAVFS
jgi:hypothetical protein